MSRESSNDLDANGNIRNGFSYDLQCWIVGYKVQRCGHPERMQCGCYGRTHAGEQVKFRDQT